MALQALVVCIRQHKRLTVNRCCWSQKETEVKRLFVIVVLLTSIVPCFGRQFKKTLDTIELSDGDTLVFCGDSITHQCLYTQYVEHYIARFKPKYVTVLIGMNDERSLGGFH